MRFFNQAMLWFQNLPNIKKIMLVAATTLLFIFIMGLSYWAFMPHYGILFNQLETKDAQQMIHQLEKWNIPYQVKNQGQEIHIPADLIEKTRLQLMGSELSFNHSVGFELFNKNDFGMTDFSQKINYQRALQGELERTIASLEEISFARVHLVIPENRLFQEENNQPRAAVTLKLKKPLTKQQVISIRRLIASSVAQLDIKNIMIVDQQGNALIASEDASTLPFKYKKSLEKYLTQKVLTVLNSLFKPEETLVKIDLTLNYDQKEQEIVRPESQNAVTHEKEIQHIRSSKIEKTHPTQDITREKTYQLGSKKEHFIAAIGTIERLSISVVLPEKTAPEKILQIEKLVKNIVGFQTKRGDSIQVEALINTKKEHIKNTIPLEIAAVDSVDKTVGLGSKIENMFLLNTYQRYILFFIFSSISTVSLLMWQRKKRQKRQILLLELTQWLEHHEK